MLIFHSKFKKVDITSFSIKLEGIKLIPSKYVKYLGFYIDENLSWGTHINELSKKLSRANGVLAKLRYFAPKKIVLLVYYTIIGNIFPGLFPMYLFIPTVQTPHFGCKLTGK